MPKFAVIQKVTERTGPSITTFGGKVIAPGQVVEISDLIELENETWGRIANRERTYVAIRIGDTEYLSELHPLPDHIIEKLISWAITKGFDPNARF